MYIKEIARFEKSGLTLSQYSEMLRMGKSVNAYKKALVKATAQGFTSVELHKSFLADVKKERQKEYQKAYRKYYKVIRANTMDFRAKRVFHRFKERLDLDMTQYDNILHALEKLVSKRGATEKVTFEQVMEVVKDFVNKPENKTKAFNELPNVNPEALLMQDVKTQAFNSLVLEGMYS